MAEEEDTAKEVAKAVTKIEKICDRLYSSADGHTGDIPDIKEHLEKVNGNIGTLQQCDADHDVQLALIHERQKNAFMRVVRDMPRWAQAIVALSVLGALTNLGLAVDQLVSLFI